MQMTKTSTPLDIWIKGRTWPPALRALGWTAVAVLLWRTPTHTPHQVVAWAMFLWALKIRPRGSPIWRSPTGLAFVALLGHLVLNTALSRNAGLSFRDFAKLMPVFAVAFAVPVLFDSKRRVTDALLVSAVGITLILATDLGRLAWICRADLLQTARFTRPYAINHPNVASMLGEAATIVLCYFAWTWRARPARLCACVLGILLNLGYVFVLRSRAPQAAFLVAACAYGLLLVGWRRRLLWFTLILLGAWLMTTQITRINPRFAARDMSSLNDRDKVWTHTWKLTKQHPVLGYGFGKKLFAEVYNHSNPPASPYAFPHAHSYWLKAAFEGGGVGLAFHLAAWSMLAIRLWRHIGRQSTFSARLLPGSVAILFLLVHVYGIGDFPDNMVKALWIWLVPVALVLTTPEPAHP